MAFHHIVYYKRKLVIMNNLYHKFAVASVCTALSFTFGANKEAKATTLTLTGTKFIVEGNCTTTWRRGRKGA
jgi:hypothetical protein